MLVTKLQVSAVALLQAALDTTTTHSLRQLIYASTPYSVLKTRQSHRYPFVVEQRLITSHYSLFK